MMDDAWMIDRRTLVTGAAAAAAFPTAAAARPAPRRTGMLNGGRPFPEPIAAQLIQALAALPYIEEGTGPDLLYVYTNQQCVNCQRMARDFPGPIPGFRTRYYLASLVGQSEHAFIRLVRARTPAMFRLYMQRRLSEAPFVLSAKDAALANGANAAKRRVEMLTRAVVPDVIYGTPFLHRVRGRTVVACAGYGPATIDKMRV